MCLAAIQHAKEALLTDMERHEHGRTLMCVSPPLEYTFSVKLQRLMSAVSLQGLCQPSGANTLWRD